MDDRRLLRRFVEENSQEAFAALTARYLTLVYSVCRRELADTEAAEDVTQAVFLILARKAPSLSRHVVLSGWLFQTARFAAKNARTREARRKAYEERAARLVPATEETDAAWAEIEPLLNPALAALAEGERRCVLLRFFQGMTFAEAGAALGLSEEAARKRVTRALEKMRKFLGKEGVVVPGVALAVLLTAHAATAAPAPVVAAVAQITPGTVPGPVSQITEGVLHAMKIAKMKVFAGAAALALVGAAATYGGVRGSDLIKKMTADSTPTEYRTVALTGKVRLSDGTGAAKVHIVAQIQNASMTKLDGSGLPWQEVLEKGASLTHTRPDGTYTLYVGENLAYNVLVVPDDIMARNQPDTGLVAAAAEGVSGRKGATVHVPDLMLTPGGFVTGTVTNDSGKLIPGVSVGSYGPHRPASSAAIISTRTDSLGRYRLRVAPGQSRVYIADDRYKERGVERGATVTVAEGTTGSADFRVTPSKP